MMNSTTQDQRAPKRVVCLYRVSTKGQVDHNDIPMQKEECLKFCGDHGWQLVNSYSEKGVSGYKVSAEKRDAILEIRKAALQGSFDVLLVYMFDRLGRKEDETPVIVQWFVNLGIEVWSVVEGQQKFDSHIDKLYNYLRFWQAEGESEKTSIRVKTRHAQITASGHFRGGTPAFGYTLAHGGRFSKKGLPLQELVIHEEEAAVVRTIFDLYVNRGFGTLRICNDLAERGIMARSDQRFTNASIQNILKRQTYLGILKSGQTQSPVIPALQIIQPELFDRAQQILLERSRHYKDRRIPLNTKGNSLLSGNVFCGHCGARLTLTTNGKKYLRKTDGNITTTPKLRYVCYNKTRHPELCNGQTGYSTRKLDAMVETVILNFFQKVRTLPGDTWIEQQFSTRISEIQLRLARVQTELKGEQEILSTLENEVIKVIQGTSLLAPEILNKKYEETKDHLAKRRAQAEQIQKELADETRVMAQVTQQYRNVMTWADVFVESPMDAKKMIVSQLISAVRVSRDYVVEIDFKISVAQFNLSDSITVHGDRDAVVV
jgi:DNA invertase Pin-like site-specific DNA recombinase/ElaB/YqjD/DUF883 family membrane-anchored ribosome-binding protein